MVYESHWLRRAREDFNDIFTYYLLQASDTVAKHRTGQILDTIDLIASMPNIGRLDTDYPHTPTYRYIVVLDYRIYYFVEDNVVNIAAIWDCRQGSLTF